MMSWYVSALAALVLMGIQRFCYKIAAARKYPTEWVTFSFMASVMLMSGGTYFFQHHHEPDIVFLFIVALVNSVCFLVATVSHIEALKYVPANIAYTIIRLNVVVVAVFSIVYFKEHISVFQALGLTAAVGAMILLTTQMSTDMKQTGYQRQGVVFIVLALLGGAVASISSKFAAMQVDKLAFMALSYLMGMIGSLGITRALSYKKAGKKRIKAAGLGLVMGGFNFAGFYAFLYALEHGPLSLVAAIVGMHFVIAVILSAIIYQEKIKPAGLAGIILTILSIILIRI